MAGPVTPDFGKELGKELEKALEEQGGMEEFHRKACIFRDQVTVMLARVDEVRKMLHEIDSVQDEMTPRMKEAIDICKGIVAAFDQ